MEFTQIFRFCHKLCRLKFCLRDWIKNVIGNVFDKIEQAEENLRDLEMIYEQFPTDSNRMQWSKAQAHLSQCLVQVEAYWRQKALVKWLKEGDSNSEYFRASLLQKRAQLSIHKSRMLMEFG